MSTTITSPDDPSLQQLCDMLADQSCQLDRDDAWPATQLDWCARHGVFEWFLPTEAGGQAWSDVDIVRGYLHLSRACLSTTFVITQRMGACRRIAVSENEWARTTILPALISGAAFATVGISHLTTSRRHWARPVLRARETADGFELDGYSPWVTGAKHADTIVMGATLDDDRQILVAMPMDLPGITVRPPAHLVGLTASCTGPVECRGVQIPRRYLLAGPAKEVMKQGIGAKTGGLQTSTLAVGMADAAIRFLESECAIRDDLAPPAEQLRADWTFLRDDLLATADGQPVCSNEDLRARANSLALRSSQAALAAAKGAGYVVGHPAGRWCRESLFFLVWSCPQPVMNASLCELAGITG